jgi:hypothetical protein
MTSQRSNVGISWHQLSTHEATRKQAVAPAVGLSEEEATERRGHHGPNRPMGRRGRGAGRRLLDQVVLPLGWY